jgi:hypothetical protein
VFLASLALLVAPEAGPEREAFDWKCAMIKMLMTFDVENDNGNGAMVAKQCEPFARRLGGLPLAKLAPANDDQSRNRLTSLIEPEIRRCRQRSAFLNRAAIPTLFEPSETNPSSTRHWASEVRPNPMASRRPSKAVVLLPRQRSPLARRSGILSPAGRGDKHWASRFNAGTAFAS